MLTFSYKFKYVFLKRKHKSKTIIKVKLFWEVIVEEKN